MVETGLPHSADGLGLAGPHSTKPGDGLLVDLTIARFDDGFFLVFRDITERQRLGRERDRLAAVVEESADAITISDAEGRIVYANPAFEAETGRVLPELIGASLPEIMLDVLGAATIEEISQSLTAGEAWLGEVTRPAANGRTRRVEIRITPRLNNGGATQGQVSVVRDVTELREAQADAELEVRIRASLAESLHAIPEGRASRRLHRRSATSS